MLKSKLFLIPLFVTIIGGIAGWLMEGSTPRPVKREILIKCRQYAYDPPVLEVNRGDTLVIKLVSMDVVHGFFVEGYNVDAEVQPNTKQFKIRHPSTDGYNWKEVNDITIITNKTGKFRFRCSHTCGSMHPFMQGELIVQPNHLFHAGLGGITGFVIGMIILFFRKVKLNSTQPISIDAGQQQP